MVNWRKLEALFCRHFPAASTRRNSLGRTSNPTLIALARQGWRVSAGERVNLLPTEVDAGRLALGVRSRDFAAAFEYWAARA
jgi:hypothetical protein